MQRRVPGGDGGDADRHPGQEIRFRGMGRRPCRERRKRHQSIRNRHHPEPVRERRLQKGPGITSPGLGGHRGWSAPGSRGVDLPRGDPEKTGTADTTAAEPVVPRCRTPPIPSAVTPQTASSRLLGICGAVPRTIVKQRASHRGARACLGRCAIMCPRCASGSERGGGEPGDSRAEAAAS